MVSFGSEKQQSKTQSLLSKGGCYAAGHTGRRSNPRMGGSV
jgi:hypothetical protein